MAKKYKCRTCGADLTFDPNLGKLKCESCGSSYYPFDYRDKMAELTKGEGEIPEEDYMVAYRCPHCGAEMITSSMSLVTRCVYCDTRTSLIGDLKDRFRPDRIVPFEIRRQEAVDAYQKIVSEAPFIPAAFLADSQIEKIQGVYVPVWLFDFAADLDCDAIFQDTDRDQVHTEEWGIVRNVVSGSASVHSVGTGRYDWVAEDGLRLLDDRIMECVGPYDFRNSAFFNSAYLIGFQAQRWDVPEEEMEERARKRVTARVKEDAADRIQLEGPAARITENHHPRLSAIHFRTCQIRKENSAYALAPVWMLYTTYRGRRYLFAVNGQTGRVAGNLPTDRLRLGLSLLLHVGLAGLLTWLMFLLGTSLRLQGGSEDLVNELALTAAIASVFLVGRFIRLLRRQSRTKLTKRNIEPPKMGFYTETLHEQKED